MKNLRHKRKVVLISLGVILCSTLAFVWKMGSLLCAPCPHKVGSLPHGLRGQNVEFFSNSGSKIRGWFLPGKKHHGAVILMHAIRGERSRMLERARFLNQAGYAVLLFDFQAHGESPGQHITFGYLEGEDAKAAVNFLRKTIPGEKIVVLGSSLGGAAALLAKPPVKVEGMILEMVYPSIEQATADRFAIRFGTLGRYLVPLLMWQLKPRLGVSAGELRPIDQVSKITVPKLFIAGTRDQHTTFAESQAMFQAAALPKEFYAVEGAAHGDFHVFAGEEYERRVLSFLRKTLQ